MAALLMRASVEEGTRTLALRYLAKAAAGLSRLDDEGDDEALHDFRVGLRRLRACIRAYHDELAPALGRKSLRRLRKLARETGPARDAEVQLLWIETQRETLDEAERHGADWIARRLADRKRLAYAHLEVILPARFGKLAIRFRERLGTYELAFEVGAAPPVRTFGNLAAAEIRAQALVLGTELRKVKSTEDELQAHRCRIHGKRLRYLLDAFKGELTSLDEAVRHLKALQDLLGELNDLHNLTGTIAVALEEAAVARARRVREAAQAEGPLGALDRVLDADERPGLLALLRRVQARKGEVFDALFSDWLSAEGHLDALLAEIERVADDLDESATDAPPVEIERKYLLSALPAECYGRPAKDIDQGWLPGDILQERVRRIRDHDGKETYKRTVKHGRGLSRIELEEPCTRLLYRALWPLTEGCRVRKRRYVVENGALTWEVDAFQDRDLFLAEVELPAEDTEVQFPDWLLPYLVREVTGEDDYVNRTLAK